MTATTTARRAGPKREAIPTAKSTAYGRAVLRAIDRMKAAGPWEFSPKLSNRHFKR